MTTSLARPHVNPLAIWAGLLILYFVWGSTYLGIRISVESMPPFLMAAARFLLSGLIVIGWCVARKGPGVLRVGLPELRDSLIVGGALLGGGMGLVAVGEQTVPAGVTALLIAVMPLWLAVFGRLFFGLRLARVVVVGIAIGLVGVAVLVAPTGGSLSFEPLNLAAVLISPISWSLGSLYATTRARLPHEPLIATALQMLCGGVVLAGMSLVAGELGGFSVAAITSDSWWAFAYLVFVGSLIGYTTYGWLLRVAPLAKIATYVYINPLVAFALGVLLLGEELSPRTLVAGLIIVSAVALIVTARSRSTPGAGPSRAIEHDIADEAPGTAGRHGSKPEHPPAPPEPAQA